MRFLKETLGLAETFRGLGCAKQHCRVLSWKKVVLDGKSAIRNVYTGYAYMLVRIKMGWMDESSQHSSKRCAKTVASFGVFQMSFVCNAQVQDSVLL